MDELDDDFELALKLQSDDDASPTEDLDDEIFDEDKLEEEVKKRKS